jgi:RNA polymerase sigma-70 factor, ECF subfamily
MQTGFCRKYSAQRGIFLPLVSFNRYKEERKLSFQMTLLSWKRWTGKDSLQTSTFEDLAIPLLPRLYNFAHWLAGNKQDAEDLVQETLLKSLRAFASFESGTNFKAWIFRILRNTWLTSRTGLAAVRTTALEDELTERGDAGQYPEAIIDRVTPELNLLRLADSAATQAAMQKLPPPLLEIILLCDVEELKYREIAVALEIPLGTVMSRVARARAFMRTELQDGAILTREARA